MFVYFARVPAAAVRLLPDGNLYAYAFRNLRCLTSGRVTVGEVEDARLLRVARIDRGEAYVYLGRAGDAIATTDNLPFDVTVEREN